MITDWLPSISTELALGEENQQLELGIGYNRIYMQCHRETECMSPVEGHKIMKDH